MGLFSHPTALGSITRIASCCSPIPTEPSSGTVFGAERSQDQEIFFAGEKPNLFLGILHSPEAKLLAYVVFVAGRFPRTSVHLKDTQHELSESKLLLQNIQGCFVPFFVKGRLLAYTDLAAPNFRIVSIDLVSPDPANWDDIVQESDKRIHGFVVANDQIFLTRIDNFSTRVEAFSLDGRPKPGILPPKYATVDLLNRTTLIAIFLIRVEPCWARVAGD